MKKITFSILLFLFSLQTFSQAPDWQWAKWAGSTGSDAGWSVATDASGNLYVTGDFNGPSITFGSITLTTSGHNIFVTKYDSNGNVLWAKCACGTGDDRSYGISTDAGGNVYIAGYFQSSSITIGSDTLTNAGGADIIVAKYDSAGNALWAKSAGGTFYDASNSISTDAGGNVYVTGHFRSSIIFGSDTLINTGLNDIFVMKYDSAGNALWAKSAGGTSDDVSYGISIDAGGNVYISGYFKSSSIAFGSTTLINAGIHNIFVAKYDSAGNALWAKSAGGTSYDESYCISTDAGGNVYISGYFFSSSITFGITTLINAGVYDIFLAKYDSAGNVLWAKRAGGTYYDECEGISTDASCNVYLTGYSHSTSIIFGSDTLINMGKDIIVAKYDSAGNALWGKNVGGTADDYGLGISNDVGGNIYLTGMFRSSLITFGSTTLTNGSPGLTDFFVAKLDTATNIPTSIIKNESPFFFLSPNPATDELRIENPEYSGLRIREIEMYNVVGEKVYSKQQTTNDKQQTVDVSQLLPGVYFVAVTDDKGNKITKRFVKM